MVALLMHAAEQGLVYGIAALGIFISYRVLRFPDLTVDGSFVTGAAIASSLVVGGGIDPTVALVLAFLAGVVAGCVTGLLHTRLGIADLLAGVLSMIMLYSINLRIMGKPSISLLRAETLTRAISEGFPFLGTTSLLVTLALAVFLAKLLLDGFLRTEVGLALRATGDNPRMVTAQAINPRTMKVLGLALSNGLVALSGALVAQYSGFADIGMGVGTIVTGLAAVIIGGSLVRSRRVGWMTAGVLLGSLIYRLAVMIALRFGYSIGFQASDVKLVTSLVVIAALVVPGLRQRFSKGARTC